MRGVVFDLDGTLIDSYAAIAESLDHARAAFGLVPLGPDGVRPHVGRGLESLIADLVGAERVDDGVRLFRERYAEAWRRGTRLLPGAGAVLARLRHAGLRLALASNKPERFGRLILAGFGLDGLFDAIEGPDTAGAAKPEPTMIRRCLERMHCSVDEALYVGDMPLDAISADRAGVAVVLVTGGSATREALIATGRPVLERLDGLPAWIAGLG